MLINPLGGNPDPQNGKPSALDLCKGPCEDCLYTRVAGWGTFPDGRKPVVPGGPAASIHQKGLLIAGSNSLATWNDIPNRDSLFFSFGRDAAFNGCPPVALCPASYSARLKLTTFDLA